MSLQSAQQTSRQFCLLQQVFEEERESLKFDVYCCKVVEGLIIRNGKARLIRDGELFHEGLINSLKRHKDDSKEVKEGLECGIGIDGIKKFIEGDIIEVYEIREVKRKLELN